MDDAGRPEQEGTDPLARFPHRTKVSLNTRPFATPATFPDRTGCCGVSDEGSRYYIADLAACSQSPTEAAMERPGARGRSSRMSTMRTPTGDTFVYFADANVLCADDIMNNNHRYQQANCGTEIFRALVRAGVCAIRGIEAENASFRDKPIFDRPATPKCSNYTRNAMQLTRTLMFRICANLGVIVVQNIQANGRR
jgi:hypothetical protein